MRWILLFLLLASCLPQGPPIGEAVFTLPLERGVEMTVWDQDESSVSLGGGHTQRLRAPSDGRVVAVEDQSLVFVAHGADAALVLQGVDQINTAVGFKACGGDPLGWARHVTLSAHWLEPDGSIVPDLSMVRVVRHGVVEELSSARLADPLESALWMPGWPERASDVNGRDCAYNRETEE